MACRNVEKAQIATKVTRALEMVRLPGVERKLPSEMSGGQQQRIALARAIVIEPDVLLLDEPLSALDANLREEMRTELKIIQREVGITTIFVTHDQEEALTLSDRVAIFNKGQVVQAGSPRAVYERPVDRFAAGFLGEANFLDGRVSVIAGGVARVVLSTGGEILTPAADLALNEAVLIALRPEKISIDPAPAGAAAMPNRILGTVVAAIFSGSSLTYRTAVGDRIFIVFEQNKSRAPLPEQSAVILEWPTADNVVVKP